MVGFSFSTSLWMICYPMLSSKNFMKMAVDRTSTEKHSLMRKLVGYRNWRQKWCKKEGNKVLRKDK